MSYKRKVCKITAATFKANTQNQDSFKGLQPKLICINIYIYTLWSLWHISEKCPYSSTKTETEHNLNIFLIQQ